MNCFKLLFVLAISLCFISLAQEVSSPPPPHSPKEVLPPPELPPPPGPPPCHVHRGPRPAHPGPPWLHLAHWLRQHDPAEFARLEQLRKQNPEAFRRELRKALRRYAETIHPDLKTHFAQQRHTWRQIRELAKRYRATTNAHDRAALEQELRAKLLSAFEARQALRKKELEQLAKRIEQLKKAVEIREQNKDALIDKQLKAILEGHPLHNLPIE